MSRDIAEILKKQKRKRLLGDSDPKLNFVLTYLLQEEVSDYLNKVKKDLEKGLDVLQKKMVLLDKIEKGKDGYTPIKDKDYFDEKDADEIKIIRNVLSKIRIPKDGKDADEEAIFKKLLSKIPEPKNGEPGKDGSPDKPEQIADKLNTLEEKVEMNVIKGLKNYFDNFNKKLQGIKSSKSGGEGMGLPIHETFNVDSTTTSITLSYAVAANGRAIFGLRYQGQTLHWGEHYTVSGKVITILETLSDNTKLDISYIRT